MFETFYEDLTFLPRRKFVAKYVMPLLIGVMSLLIIGQLLSHLITVGQLNKTSGTITDIRTKIVSWSHSRYSNHDTPDYALVITLDNMDSYNIQEEAYRIKLGAILKNGDQVTVYYPNSTLKILTTGFARDVCQVQTGDKVLYSWSEQQEGNWFIVLIYAGLLAFFYWMRGYLREYVDSSTLK